MQRAREHRNAVIAMMFVLLLTISMGCGGADSDTGSPASARRLDGAKQPKAKEAVLAHQWVKAGPEVDQLAVYEGGYKPPARRREGAILAKGSQWKQRSVQHVPGRGQTGMPVQWHILEPPTESTVSIGSDVAYCPGSGRVPRISGVKQINRPGAVILTAYFAGRPPHFSGTEACLGAQIGTRVHIRGGLRGRPLYDGSQSPPKRKRWPR